MFGGSGVVHHRFAGMDDANRVPGPLPQAAFANFLR